MNLLRRDFLKKTGLLTVAGLLPPGVIQFQNIYTETKSHSPEEQNFLIRNVHILSMDEEIGDPKRSSVLVENGLIKEISPQINAPEGITIIDGTDGILLPGLIDNHWHLWTSLLRSMSGSREE